MTRYDIRTGVKKIKTKTALIISGGTLGFAGLVMAVIVPFGAHAATGAAWQLNAPRALTFVCGGSNYEHTLKTVNENPSTGAFTGTGSYNPDPSYTWTTSGTVTGDAVSFAILYTGTSPGTVYHLDGTIAPDGSISGTSDSNCQTFFMPAGSATMVSYVIVTPTNQQGWSSTAPIADTRTGGAVSFNNDMSAPGDPHNGALSMTTDATTTAKAQYFHNTATPLSTVTELSYSTKQNAPIGPVADASYQLAICATGVTGTACNPQFGNTTSSFTTLVYEPYQGGQGTVVNNVWQNWNISSGGLFWTTRTVVCSNGTLTGTTGGPATYTLAAVQAACPDAFVFQFGLNIGSNNPGYNVETDLFNFNGTTYNFEPFVVANDKDQCKSGGWTTLTDANGKSFKNQGDCVSYVATHGKNQANG